VQVNGMYPLTITCETNLPKAVTKFHICTKWRVRHFRVNMSIYSKLNEKVCEMLFPHGQL